MRLKGFQHSFADSSNLDPFPVIIQSARPFIQIDLSKVYSFAWEDTLSFLSKWCLQGLRPEGMEVEVLRKAVCMVSTWCVASEMNSESPQPPSSPQLLLWCRWAEAIFSSLNIIHFFFFFLSSFWNGAKPKIKHQKKYWKTMMKRKDSGFCCCCCRCFCFS